MDSIQQRLVANFINVLKTLYNHKSGLFLQFGGLLGEDGGLFVEEIIIVNIDKSDDMIRVTFPEKVLILADYNDIALGLYDATRQSCDYDQLRQRLELLFGSNSDISNAFREDIEKQDEHREPILVNPAEFSNREIELGFFAGESGYRRGFDHGIHFILQNFDDMPQHIQDDIEKYASKVHEWRYKEYEGKHEAPPDI